MRVVFLGSPPFAVPILAGLLAGPHPVVGVVTQPARPAGRGRRSEPSAVEALARAHGVPLLTPETTRDPAFVAALRALTPDVLLVASYGEILRQDVLDLAPLGAFNVHASLLPRWRGAAPIQRAIQNGDRISGVCVQRMVRELDAGDLLLSLELEIGPRENAGELLARLADLGARAAREALDLLARGEARLVPQDPARVTWAPKLTKEEGRIDWSAPALALDAHVRAMTPWPGARTREPGGRDLLVERAAPAEGSAAPPGIAPGTLLATDGELLVATGEGVLRLERVRPAGKSSLAAAEYLRGARLSVGERLGAQP